MKCLAALSLLSVTCLHGLTINVDISASLDRHYEGPGVLAGAGPNWNALVLKQTLSSSFLTTIQDAQGNLVSNGLVYLQDLGGNNLVVEDSGVGGNPNPAALMEDYAAGGNYNFIIGGLPAGEYALYLFTHGDSAEKTTTVTLSADNGSAAASTATTGEAYRDLLAAGAVGEAYLAFDSVPVGGSGLLQLTATGYLNGCQVIKKDPLSIRRQPPASMEAYAGTDASITVAPSGPDALLYQWQKSSDGGAGYVDIDTDQNPSAATSTLVLVNLQIPDSGLYRVVVTSPFESVTSTATTLTVEPDLRPVIIQQPQTQAVPYGERLDLAVVTESTEGVTYQWFKDGSEISGANSATFTIPAVGLDDSGIYIVAAVNESGITYSEPAVVTLSPRPTAFPGAEGFGAVATGGRGGDVYHVTSLADTQTQGTFRHAISTAPVGGRTIVFDVSGNIHLTDSISILRSNITIAGQTAPGQGITLSGGSLWLEGENLIVRNIRTRLGATPADGEDAISIWDGSYIMVDHCSGSWATDENVSMTHYANYNTIQYTIISEPTDASNHARSSLFRPGSSTPEANHTLFHLSVHHCLYAHGSDRNPVMSTYNRHTLRVDFRNNLVFDWRNQATHTGDVEQYVEVNFISNYYVTGLTTRADIVDDPSIFNSGSTDTTIYYNEDNLVDATRDDGLVNPIYDPSSINGARTETDIPFTVAPVTTQTAVEAYETVLTYSGAFWWNRDPVDERVTTDVREISDPDPEVRANSGMLILTEDEVGGLPVLTELVRPQGWDTDADGMPDEWELQHGLDPIEPENNGDFDNDLYTNLEEYINQLGAFPAPYPLVFVGDSNNRYAWSQNWSADWQPSHLDRVRINNRTVVVDAVGQYAGTLSLEGDSILEVTSGWLQVAENLTVYPSATNTVADGAELRVFGDLTNHGILRLVGQAVLSVEGTLVNYGTLDLRGWIGSLPANFINQGTVLTSNSILLLGTDLGPAGFSVSIEAEAGQTYQLQYSTGLHGESWTTVDEATAANNGELVLRDSDAASRERSFYRVIN